MRQYLQFLHDICHYGEEKADRTGVGTISLFGYEMRFDLSQGFPLVTTKQVHLKSVIYELLWFLRGDTNVRYLQERGVRIWNPWADEQGDLGPVYGKQWRQWQASNGHCIDQIQNVVDEIQRNPNSRRLIVNAWNVGELDKMALPPCHVMFQFHVSKDRLSCKLTQRSADGFLGVPFNIASYALLTHMVAHVCGLGVGELIWSGGDCHIYQNHCEQVKEQLEREPFPLPTLRFRRQVLSLFDFEYDDFIIENYRCHPPIKAPIAV